MTLATRIQSTTFAALVLVCNAVGAQATSSATQPQRQSLDEAWWTGPVIAASAGTLPQGHFLIEPYFYDAITYGRYDDDGDERDRPRTHSFGSLTYMLYGLADKFTVGLIPTFGFNDLSAGRDSSGIGFGDLTLQAQYRLSLFREGTRIPTTSFVVQQSLPTGEYDRLGDRPSDGFGAGVYTTTVALFSQYYFWLPNGRILRSRLNVSYAFSDDASVEGVSVYDTAEGFRGRASPGDSFSIVSAWEYSMTQSWVLALDLIYGCDDSTHVRGSVLSGTAPPVDVAVNSGSSRRFGVVPAIEYNWNGHVGIIVGARWFAAGRNATASITPVVGINMVY